MLTATAAPPALRPYQEEARAAVLDAFDRGEPSALLVMATGTGKTVVFARIVADRVARGGRALVLAHQGELLRQASAHLRAEGLRVAVEKGTARARPGSLYDEVVVASVQTLKKDRLASWDPGRFDTIVVDEAHHGLAPSYRAVLRHFGAARVLGVTATPERGDGGKLGKVFGHLAYEYSLADAVAAGHLCRLRVERPTTSVDLAKIRTTRGDLNAGDLEDAIRPHVEELVNALRARIGDRPTLVFTPDVGSAQAFASGLRQVGVAARSVSGDSPDRDAIMLGFAAADFQALCNCVLVTEGVDVPRIAAIGMCRPTRSGVLYRQMAGRGTRNCPGKDDCLIVDFAWNSGQHDLCSPVDLFDAAGADEDVLAIADGLLRTYPGIDPLKAIGQAGAIHRRRAAVAVSVAERESRYKFVAFDPLAIGALLGVPRRKPGPNALPVGPAQATRLSRYKLSAEGLTARQAEKLLAHLDDRRRQDLASHRQVAALVANGVPPDEATTLSFADASARLDVLIGKSRQLKSARSADSEI